MNGFPFLIIYLKNIILFTVEHIPSCTVKKLSSSIIKIVKVYTRGGFQVHLVFIDMEFEKTRDEFVCVELNSTATQEHVGEIEQGIHTAIECRRCILSDLHLGGVKYFNRWIVV